MNNQMPFTPIQREVWINSRSLLLKAIDIMDKFFCVGKYKPPKEITITPQDSFAGVVAAVSEQVQNDNVPSM